MGTRLTDTDKWDDPWYMELPGAYKLAWDYLCDNCDFGGVIDLNKPLAAFRIKMDIDWDEFIDEAARGRVIRLQSGKLWLKGFVAFQCKTWTLNLKNKAHLGAFRLLQRSGADWSSHYQVVDGASPHTVKTNNENKSESSPKKQSALKEADKPLERRTGIGVGVGVVNKKKRRKSDQPDYSEDFLAFWEIFPSGRKTKKPDAFTIWQGLSATDRTAALSGAKEYAETELGRGEFVQGPVPWLNQRRWEDDRKSWGRKVSQSTRGHTRKPNFEMWRAELIKRIKSEGGELPSDDELRKRFLKRHPDVDSTK